MPIALYCIASSAFVLNDNTVIKYDNRLVDVKSQTGRLSVWQTRLLERAFTVSALSALSSAQALAWHLYRVGHKKG